MSNAKSLQFVGLPRSGKTTYLAALWHVLVDQSSATTLKLKKLSGDRTYLNGIVKEWRACKPVPRTTLQADDNMVAMHLEGDGFGEFTLSVPDLSGEVFEALLEHRKLNAAHADLFRHTDGVLLFVHPDVKNGVQISDQDQMMASIGATTEAGSVANGPTAGCVPWRVEMLPTQAKLVELLQFLLELADQRLRVAVVVSAWDLVTNAKPSQPPHEYVSRRMPLLRQFLNANDDVFDHAVFGISAQGGEIPGDKTKLLVLDSLKRVQASYESENDHDITKPLAWLLGEK